MIQIEECPVCRSKSLNPVFKTTDCVVSGDSFGIVECGSCQIRLTQPIPDEEEILSYYDSEDYISHSETTRGLINRLYAVVRKVMIVRKRKLAQSLGPSEPGKLLEIGCGAGAFLNGMNQSGWEVLGIEPDERIRDAVRARYGLAVVSPEEWFSQPESSYDVITLWHVLEHLHNLDDYLRKISTSLEDDGVLIVAVPNYYSYDAEYYQSRWAAYDVPRHLYHFTYKSLTELLKHHGLTVTAIRRLPFDAFYVSMLSEKYKEGFTARGLLIGLISCLKAFINVRRSSSIICIAEHKNP
ncbi:MAG: class I SAM-dependent methyltransferase [Fidelibacterota bacterium]|nr:MAG: class I SAM-dependent methyltransferase [Candidatus Neomarinimicrobiota bacterium]